jgi:hypothetical protein
MRKVEIHHQARNSLTGQPEGFVHVANIGVSDGIPPSEALSYAWRWTNNLDGSWSMGEVIAIKTGQMFDNTDYNPNTEVLAELPVHNGRTYGLRSSMVGDRFVIDGVRYLVARVGFELEA